MKNKFHFTTCLWLTFILRLLMLRLRAGMSRALSSGCKWSKLILRVRCLSYHLISQRKKAVIQKYLQQIHKAFNQHDIAGNTNYLGINAQYSKMINLVSGCCEKRFPKNVSCMGRGMLQGYDNKILRPCASFMIGRIQLKFKNH